jgi:hypothetical protein
MMLECWAYIFDVVAFYDSEIAQNLYLRTATDTGALRRLVGLIGYHLRPAVVAEPKGTAFRSSAFGNEPPQVFESDADLMISPHTNKWTLAPVMRTAAKAGDRLLYDIAALRLTREAIAVFTWTGATTIAKVTAVDPIRAVDGKSYANVTTDPAVSIPTGLDVTSVVTRVPTGTAGINRIDTAPVTSTTILLDAIYPQISAGWDLILSRGSQHILVSVSSVAVAASTPTTRHTRLAGPSSRSRRRSIPPDQRSEPDIRFQLVDGGRLARPAEIRIQRTDLNPSAALAGVAGLAGGRPGPFLLQDRDKSGRRSMAPYPSLRPGRERWCRPP